jgi:hypothetical protein
MSRRGGPYELETPAVRKVRALPEWHLLKPFSLICQQSLFFPRHSREGLESRNVSSGATRRLFDQPPFGQEKTNWISAFAGMTKLYLFDSKML